MSKQLYSNILNFPSFSELYKEILDFSGQDNLNQLISVPKVKNSLENFLDFFSENPEKNFSNEQKILNKYDLDKLIIDLISILSTELKISKEKIFWLIENYITNDKKNEKNFKNFYQMTHMKSEYKINTNFDVNERILFFKENIINFYFEERTKCLLCARFVIQNYFDIKNNQNLFENNNNENNENEDDFIENNNINNNNIIILEKIINIENFLMKLYKKLISYDYLSLGEFDKEKVEIINKRNNQIILEQENILILMIFICNYNKFINKEIFDGLLNYFIFNLVNIMKILLIYK